MTTATVYQRCKDKVRGKFTARIADIRKLWTLYTSDPEASDPDLGTFNEYGLAFDYVAPHTFTDQRRGYWRYQISWGGPSDEFRFYADENKRPTRIEYWFMDWFDGAKVTLKQGANFDLLSEIFDDFDGMGMLDHERTRATE